MVNQLFGLKGWRITAQGNALGWWSSPRPAALSGQGTTRKPCPFRAVASTPCPGLERSGLSGRTPNLTKRPFYGRAILVTFGTSPNDAPAILHACGAKRKRKNGRTVQSQSEDWATRSTKKYHWPRTLKVGRLSVFLASNPWELQYAAFHND